MKKDTQGFVKQADLTCSLARCREYDRKRHAGQKERRESQQKKGDDTIRQTNEERQARFVMLKSSEG